MSSIKKYVIGLVVVVAVILGIFFTQGQSKYSSVTAEPVVLGSISNMSGDYAAVGEAFTNGVKLAQEQWNASHKQQFKVVFEDDGFNAQKGLTAYKKLTAIDHIQALINTTTITIDAIHDDVVASGMPVALGFEQGIEAKDDNIVQLWPGSIPTYKNLGEYVKSKGYKNVVVFAENGNAVWDRFLGSFKEGYDLPYTEIRMVAGSKDIRSDVTKAILTKPDAIVFFIRPEQGVLLINTLEQQSKTKYQYIFDPSIQTGFNDYVKLLGDANRLNGSITLTTPTVYQDKFKADYMARFGHEASVGSETGYNAFTLLAETYNPNKVSWVKAMKTHTFEGADGKISFDKNGIRLPEVKVGVIENGKLPQ